MSMKKRGYNNRQAEDQDENDEDVQKKVKEDKGCGIKRPRPARVGFRWMAYRRFAH